MIGDVAAGQTLVLSIEMEPPQVRPTAIARQGFKTPAPGAVLSVGLSRPPSRHRRLLLILIVALSHPDRRASLIHSNFTEADIRGVVDAAIGPHQTHDGRIHVNGGTWAITAQQALGLSLAIHELATNAAKYGALSTAEGTVDVARSISNEAFAFTWIETGGPSVSAPGRRGFGSKLIERIVASYFDGEGRIESDPAGIRFKLTRASDRAELAV